MNNETKLPSLSEDGIGSEFSKSINPYPTVYAPDSELMGKIEALQAQIVELEKESPQPTREELIASAKADVIKHLKPVLADGPAERIATHKYLAPRDREPLWVLMFDDADRGYSTFKSEAEGREAFGFASQSWNCTLLAPVPVEPAAPVVQLTGECNFPNCDCLPEAECPDKASQPTPVVVPTYAYCQNCKIHLSNTTAGLRECPVCKGSVSEVKAEDDAPVVVPEDEVPTDNFWEASKFAGITFSQGCQFHLMMQSLLGKAPAPGFLIPRPAALPVGQKEAK